MTKILVVDDDPQVTAMLEKLLTLEGFETTSVTDSAQAMQVATSTNPDFFILDLMMPQPNGFEVTRMLRADPNFEKTPILIITASDDADSKAIAYVAGADDYITKPFDHDELPGRIRALLNKTE
jgi:DNA-binding response OmpR family regulator